jgi:signal transduction histidine kinase
VLFRALLKSPSGSADFPFVAGLLTAEGRRHVRLMLHELAPRADRLERRFRAWLSESGYDAMYADMLVAITPAAAARCPSLDAFLKQVGSGGRRLAKWNLSLAKVNRSLRKFDQLAAAMLQGRFAPAREQLLLAANFLLNQAFYQVREAESQAFFGLRRAEAEAGDLNDLVGRFARVLVKAFGADAGRLVLKEQALPADIGRPLYIKRGSPEQRSIADARWRGRHSSYWSYPFGPSAVLQLAFRRENPWSTRDEILLSAAAASCRKAIERTRMAQQIRRLQAESLRIEEEERRRIGRDLHDEAGQALALLRLQLEMIERDAPERLRPRISAVRELAARTTVELRRIVARLSPSVLERLGVETALRLLIGRFRHTHGARTQYRALRLTQPLPRPAQEVIYRVAQECLQNVAKHSGATRVNLSLRSTDKKIRLSVRDNGAGFCADQALLKPRSFGLAGMRERALLLGGTLHISTAPGKGTEVILELPAPVVLNGKNSRIAD